MRIWLAGVIGQIPGLCRLMSHKSRNETVQENFHTDAGESTAMLVNSSTSHTVF